MDFAGPLARVGLRYLAGILVAKGMTEQAGLLSDPDFVQVASYVGAAVCSGISEGWWYLARKKGWNL
jgi:hypothetical protein